MEVIMPRKLVWAFVAAVLADIIGRYIYDTYIRK
jgi:hypothetical protein